MMLGKLNRLIRPVIKFVQFSQKQMQILTWWCKSSPYKDYMGIVADGSIRAGKTVSMAVSFIFWAMHTYDGQNFILSGKTVGSFRRNVWRWLKPVLIIRGYIVEEQKIANLIMISDGIKINYFYVFGGRDESSQDLVQGITAAGAFFDEVALMPQSFVNQATGRCSVDGAKLWFNCNPDSPMHYFLKEWIQKADEKKLFHIHFTMDDNPSLSDEVKARYKSMYSGVFFQRFILGLWVMAQGAVYKDAWTDENVFGDDVLEWINLNIGQMKRYIFIDYGTINPMVFLNAYDDGRTLWVTDEYYYDSKATGVEKDNSQYGDDLMAFINKRPDIWPAAVVIDPSAASFKIEMRNRGLRAKETVETINADNNVLDGIRMVSTMLTKKILRMHKSCVKTREEMTAYAWDDKALITAGKEKPVKVDDHCPDAVRYGCMTVIKPRRLVNV